MAGRPVQFLKPLLASMEQTEGSSTGRPGRMLARGRMPASTRSEGRRLPFSVPWASVCSELLGKAQVHLLLSLHGPQTIIPLQITSSSVLKDLVSQKCLLPHPHLP